MELTGMDTALHESSVHHSAERLARAIWAATAAKGDPKTLASWACHVNASVPALRNWSYVANVPPRNALLVARLLRALVRAALEGGEPADLLDVSDPRTLRALLNVLRVDNRGLAPWPRPTEFLQHQRLIASAPTVAALRELAERNGDDHGHTL